MKMITCPKCQSPNVFVSETGVGWDPNLFVAAGGDMEPTYEWETHLCTDCGYFENYITDNDCLQKIKEGRWEDWRKAE